MIYGQVGSVEAGTPKLGVPTSFVNKKASTPHLMV